MEVFIQFIQQLRLMVPKEALTGRNVSKPFYPIYPTIISELPFLYPTIWEEIDQFRHSLIERIATLLENEKDDYIKETIHVKVISLMLFAIVETIIHPQFLNQHHISFEQAFQSAMELLFTGIIRDEKQQEIMKQIYTSNTSNR